MTLTPRMAHALGFIQCYQATEHRSPTYQEISRELKLSGRGHAHNLVKRLIERGVIERDEGRFIILKPIPVTLSKCVGCHRVRMPRDCKWIPGENGERGRLLCTECQA